LVTQWKDNGELIIIGLDINENAWDNDEASQIESWGLVDALKEQHPETYRKSPPATKIPKTNLSTVYGAHPASTSFKQE
jgi:hypothetical protein